MATNIQLTQWATAIGAGVLVVLQGLNLHSTGEISHEARSAETQARTAGEHLSTELSEIRHLQQDMNTGLSRQQELMKNQQAGLQHLAELVKQNSQMADEIKAWMDKASPSPSQRPR